MNIALIGYGQMGKEIEKIVQERGHNIALIIEKDNAVDLNAENLSKVDVAIEFSRPESAVDNYKNCFANGVPVVSGTTGWLDKLPEIIKDCEGNKSGFFYASNFSLGVNLFFELNKKLAQLINPFKDDKILINEIHHSRKLDAPSGTAITLAEGIIANSDNKTSWKNNSDIKNNELEIHSIRTNEVPGTHIVEYKSDIDKITLKHEAFGREGFALGAVLSAEFVYKKTGLFSIDDLLKINLNN